MKIKRNILFALIVFLSLNLTGCIGVNRNFRIIQNKLNENLNVKYYKTIEFSVGEAGLLLAGMFVRLSDVEEPVDEILSEVSRVQVGIYERQSAEGLRVEFSDLKEISDIMEEQGWKYIVRSVKGDEMVGVFVGKDDTEFKQLYVIAVENEEMVIVEVLGDLDKIIEIAVREKGLHFDVAKH